MNVLNLFQGVRLSFTSSFGILWEAEIWNFITFGGLKSVENFLYIQIRESLESVRSLKHRVFWTSPELWRERSCLENDRSILTATLIT